MLLRRCLLVIVPVVLCADAPGAVLSVGHRGDSMFNPENTIASFFSCQGKADLVELDGRVTSDGHLVVMHDAAVDRTTDGTGSVAAKTLTEIRTLDAGSWFSAAFIGEKVPTVEESITNILPFATPLIEQKAGTAAQYANELRRLNVISNVVVQSFDWAFLKTLHGLEPGIRLGALGSGNFTAATLTNILNAGAQMVAWEKGNVTATMLDLVRSAGLKAFVWTVNGAEIRSFIDLGVDGIISDDPWLVQNYQEPPTHSLPLRSDLVAHWKMDDGLSNVMASVVADSASTNDMALVRGDGLSHWTGGLLDGALELDALNAWVPLPRNPAMDIGTNALSLSMWVRLRALPSQLTTPYGAILDSTNDCYVLYLDRSNKELRFKVTDTAGHAARPGIAESRLSTNQWLHLVATYSGQLTPQSGQATIYLNGEPRDVHTGNDSSSPLGLTGPVKPGQAAAMGREGLSGGNTFSGLVDDFALWRRALSPSEISRIYEAGLLGQPLSELLVEPTALIQYRAVRVVNGQLQIDFVCLGTWQNFGLMLASRPGGPFTLLSIWPPVSLGARQYRFSVPITEASAFYRVTAN